MSIRYTKLETSSENTQTVETESNSKTNLIFWLVLCCVLAIIFTRHLFTGDPIVQTIYGKIEGFNYESAEVFLGIPYAKQPAGDLRLEKPQSQEPWNQTFKAKNYGKDCGPNPEQCLVLNIVKPKSANSDPKGYPVLVFIHGGAFHAGSTRTVGYKRIAERLVPKGVVVVTINYRLGFFGFFSTGTPEAPGNVGVWDQIEALRFVQNIIRAFNGDPNQVTIWGESAGSVTASYLTITPHADNLFQKAILMSGSALANWADGNKTIEISWEVLKRLGCDKNANPKSCALKHSTQEIINALNAVYPYDIVPDSTNFIWMHPVFNSDLFPNAVSLEDAINKAKKRENLIGVTSQEDAPMAIRFNDNRKGNYHPMPFSIAQNFTENLFREYISAVFDIQHLSKEYANSVIEFYLQQRINYSHNQTFQAYVQFFSDIEFNIPALREAKIKAAANNPVYFYLLDIPPKNNVPLTEGAPHTTQTGMFFDTFWFITEEKYDADLLEVVVSFAKNGVPSTSTGLILEKVTEQNVPYVSIDKNSSLHSDLWPDRVDFYNDISERYNFDLPRGKRLSA